MQESTRDAYFPKLDCGALFARLSSARSRWHRHKSVGGQTGFGRLTSLGEIRIEERV
jgi:hypothetical protein